MRAGRLLIALALATLVLQTPFGALADESADDGEEETESDDADASEARVEALEKRILELEARDAFSRDHIGSLEWDADRDYLVTQNRWFVTTHGYLRTRAVLEANTVNGYTNAAGEEIFAYDPRSTFKNDYGWWDTRLSSKTIVNFGDTAEIVLWLQLGDWVWGTQSPAFGGTGRGKFDSAGLQAREAWARYELEFIPVAMEFGRMPWVLGNGIIQGNEQDGARLYWFNKWIDVGFGAFRQYEGENIEMSQRFNDDEDTFVFWATPRPGRGHEIELFGWLNLFETPELPARMNPDSPLFRLPGYTQARYASQGSELWNVGANWRGELGAGFAIDIEIDKQFGEIKPAADRADVEAIEFSGAAAYGKLSYHYNDRDQIALAGGYGTGDDPDTRAFEGYFAPDHRFGWYDEVPEEPIRHAFFGVYDHTAPGAGVPGRYRDNLGAGGLDNTQFVNLAWDTWRFLRNHHFYVSVGAISASRANPDTDARFIGIENDMWMDYIFSNNVTFSLYGGHLFLFDEYFQKDNHDAAILRGDWKLSW
ncbi:hypothetical protein K8I61_19335 [bacterium]|nr:hypothetical protein [bacterium]